MFERFTDRARRALSLAQDEARVLNHGFIGTEHLLLGLIREDEGVAGHVIKSFGLSLEKVRQKVAETIGPGGASPGGAPPFTPRAKKVLELSLREALQLGHNYLGTEHMLLGLVREGEGVACQVLTSLGAGLPQVRERVLAIVERGVVPEQASKLRAPPGWIQPGLTPSADPPDCPQCGASLAKAARHRLLDVPVGSGDQPDQPFVVVYCGHCGRSLAFKPGE